MTDRMFHETIQINAIDLPIQVFKQDRMADSKGAFLHWHEQIEIYYVVKGGLQLLCNGKIKWIYAGDIGFINWCQPHRGRLFMDDTVFYTIQIDLSQLDTSLLMENNDFVMSRYNQVPTYIHNNLVLKKLFNSLIKEYRHRDEASSLFLKGILYTIFATLIRLKGSETNVHNTSIPTSLITVREILRYIADNYSQVLSLTTICHEFGLSKSHMSHIFKEHTGQTVHQYINDYRCQTAATLILNQVPLNEIYQSVGFTDYNYFSRTFKKIYAVSPNNFRKLKGIRP